MHWTSDVIGCLKRCELHAATFGKSWSLLISHAVGETWKLFLALWDAEARLSEKLPRSYF